MMHKSTKKWLFLKISSALLIPLMLWFIINFVSIFDNEYQELLLIFKTSTFKSLFSLFLVLMFFNSSLNISEIFEDYISNENIKNVANKVLYIFAIITPLITIILLNI